MPPTIAIALLFIALVLCAVQLVESDGKSLPGWTGALISSVLILERL